MVFGRIAGLVLCMHLVAYSSCQQTADSQVKKMEKRDTAINISNSFTEMFFDSVALEVFLRHSKVNDSTKSQIRDFYNVRNYQFAWFSNGVPIEQAINFWNLQSNYIANTGDSSIYNPMLQQFEDSIQQAGFTPLRFSEQTALPYELALTEQFFRYAIKAYQGSGNLRPSELKWYIPRRKVDVSVMLDSITRAKGRIEAFEPVNRQYAVLRDYLFKYNKIRESGGWNPIVGERKKYVKGDSIPQVLQIKRRLQLMGDLTTTDSTMVFDDTLVAAVKRFQQRYGLNQDGIVEGSTLREMNTPLIRRIRQLLVNMERMKWVPAQPSGDFLVVNIPEFTLHGYENGKHIFKMNVVVGSTQNHTVIFTGKLKYVVFSPYWNVPTSILKKEVLPGIRKNPNYLEEHDMEWDDGKVRQKPGPSNSLGLVKFLFPNSYNIYLHDTPSKNLFNESKRAFSHGCIRISEPTLLAEWVLRNQPEWTPELIQRAMHAGRERFVLIKRDINVFVGYFTAFVDRNGKLNFREDIYGHDHEMEERMFGEEK